LTNMSRSFGTRTSFWWPHSWATKRRDRSRECRHLAQRLPHRRSTGHPPRLDPDDTERRRFGCKRDDTPSGLRILTVALFEELFALVQPLKSTRAHRGRASIWLGYPKCQTVTN
jgi:hypothetical protein